MLHDGAFFADIENGATPVCVTQFMATDQLPGWAFSFALGMTGAWLYHRYSTRQGAAGMVSKRVALGIVAVGLVAFGILGYMYAEAAANNGTPLGSLSARMHEPLLGLAYSASRGLLMAGIVLAPLWLQAPFTNRPVRVGADLSYAVYLIHMPMALFVAGAWLGIRGDGSAWAFVELSSVVLAGSFAYAYVSNRLVERPATRWARRVTAPDAERSGIAARALAPP